MSGAVLPGPWGQRESAPPPFDAPVPDAAPEDDGKRGGKPPGDDGDEGQPENFGSVVPLGTAVRREQHAYVLLASSGKRVVLNPRDMHSLSMLAGLFGGARAKAYMVRRWPQLRPKRNEQGRVERDESGAIEMVPTGDFSARDLGDALMSACDRLGPADSLVHRFDGVWPGPDGGLIVHVGKKLWTHPDAVERPMGWCHGGAVHLSGESLPWPAEQPATAAQCLALRQHFNLWHYRASMAASAPVYLMGMVACGIYAGALDWRPHLWLRGPTNAGKSSLQKLLKLAIGAADVSEDVSEPYVRNVHDGRGRAILLDEREPNSAGVNAVLQLMRGASSGGRAGRLMDGAAKSYTVAVPFILAAISTPAFEAADASRITTIQLMRPEGGDRQPELKRAWAEAEALHPALFTRLIQGWARFRENREVYRGALLNGNATSRCADQLAALLAGHRTLVDDQPIDAMAAAEELSALDIEVITPDLAAESDAPTMVLAHLLASRMTVGDGRQSKTVAALAEDLRDAHAEAARSDGPPDAAGTLKRLVKEAGMLQLRWEPGEGLVIGNTSPAVNKAFDGTAWANKVWRQHLQDLPGATDAGATNFRGGGKARAVLVPEAVLGLLPPDAPRRHADDPF